MSAILSQFAILDSVPSLFTTMGPRWSSLTPSPFTLSCGAFAEEGSGRGRGAGGVLAEEEEESFACASVVFGGFDAFDAIVRVEGRCGCVLMLARMARGLVLGMRNRRSEVSWLLGLIDLVHIGSFSTADAKAFVLRYVHPLAACRSFSCCSRKLGGSPSLHLGIHHVLTRAISTLSGVSRGFTAWRRGLQHV